MGIPAGPGYSACTSPLGIGILVAQQNPQSLERLSRLSWSQRQPFAEVRMRRSVLRSVIPVLLAALVVFALIYMRWLDDDGATLPGACIAAYARAESAADTAQVDRLQVGGEHPHPITCGRLRNAGS